MSAAVAVIRRCMCLVIIMVTEGEDGIVMLPRVRLLSYLMVGRREAVEGAVD
jgi:hypothetical protein